MDKITEERLTINSDKKRLTEWFERAKENVIELISKGTPETITKLEDYTEYGNMRRYAMELEIVNAKLRVINYISE